MGEKISWEEGGSWWNWNWNWTRRLRGRNVGLFNDLLLALQDFSPSQHQSDKWNWLHSLVQPSSEEGQHLRLESVQQTSDCLIYSSETVDHILLYCLAAADIWRAISVWCDINTVCFLDFVDVLEGDLYSQIPQKQAQVWRAIIYINQLGLSGKQEIQWLCKTLLGMLQES